MYRNSYLQLYKTTANSNPNITLLLAHFSQIYNTLGCVLQDLEFQIGKIIAEQSQPSIDMKQQYEMYKKNRKGDIKVREKDKEVVKVQEKSIDQNSWKNSGENQERSNKVEPKGNQKGCKTGEQGIREANLQQFSGGSWMDRVINHPSKNQNEFEDMKKNLQKSRNSAPPIFEKPRGHPSKPKGNDSFDSLFENMQKEREKPVSMEIQHPKHRSSMPPIPQMSQQNSSQGREIRVQPTQDDFFQRIFKEGESRKSK